MKTKELIKELESCNPEAEVRIMDVAKEEVDDLTYCPAFDFSVGVLRSDGKDKELFVALQFDSDKD